MKKVIRYFSDAVNFMTSGVSFRFRCPQLPAPWLVGNRWGLRPIHGGLGMVGLGQRAMCFRNGFDIDSV